jgi:hypothetical protein
MFFSETSHLTFKLINPVELTTLYIYSTTQLRHLDNVPDIQGIKFYPRSHGC